jgi:hypothetical protein
MVSGILTEKTQQIHSFRASGVISSNVARAAGSEMRTFRKSAGTSCTAPGEIVFWVIGFILMNLWFGKEVKRKKHYLLSMANLCLAADPLPIPI